MIKVQPYSENIEQDKMRKRARSCDPVHYYSAKN